jgi:hypothetical protein
MHVDSKLVACKSHVIWTTSETTSEHIWTTSKPAIGDHMPIWPKVLSLFCKRKGKGKRKQNQKAEQLNTVFPHRPSWPRETLQETQSKNARLSRKSNTRLQRRKQHLQRLLPFANCRWKCDSPHISLQLIWNLVGGEDVQLPSKITSMWDSIRTCESH